jgi:hypothetical protein
MEPIQKGRKVSDKDIERLRKRLGLQRGRTISDKDIERLLEAGNSNSRRNRQEMAYGGVANKKKKMRGGGEYREEMKEGGRPGLWANIHAKRKRIKAGSGETMRKKGDKGAPTEANIKRAQKGTKNA